MSERNKAALLRAIELFNAGDEAYFDFYTPDVRVHGLPGPGGPADHAAMVEFYRRYWAAFPDGRVDALELIAEGDLIAARFRISGTHTGELMGAEPTGRQVAAEAITIMRLNEEARCVERWSRLDEVSFLTQIGLMPAPAAVEA